MKKMEIIPAIDVIDGKCVRLSQGNYDDKIIYYDNPLEVAKRYEEIGIKRLHLVDLDGAKANKIINYKILEMISKNTDLIIDFGGGLKAKDDFKKAFDYGADMVTGGSIAVCNKDIFLEVINLYGADKIILGADVKNGYIFSNGWKNNSYVKIFDFLKFYMEIGLKNVICTDISKDGMLKGPAFDLYQKIIEKFPEINLIASGGVSNEDDIKNLEMINCFGVIIGKAIYENNISLKEII